MIDFEEIKRRLLALDTAAVCDADKELRVMDSGIRPLKIGSKMVGVARTVQCQDDFLTVIKALADSQRNEVLVIDSQGSQPALAGELFATEAARRGLAGIVVDGGFRDTAKVRTMSLPVFARHVVPMSGTTNSVFDTQITVNCGGCRVRPGEILFGDDDGIVVLEPESIGELLNDAEAIQTCEAEAMSRMAGGESLIDLLNFREHYGRVCAGEPSKLKFTL